MPLLEEAPLIDVASRIGARLVDQAIWDGPECTWTVVVPDLKRPESRTVLRQKAGGGLYQGSAGIALFLAELWAVTAERRYLECACAAIRHALSEAQGTGASLIGLYSGATGIAYALARLAVLTREQEWRDLAQFTVETKVGPAVASDSAHDMIAGSAGAVVGLIRIYDLLGLMSALDHAVSAGAHLEAVANRRPNGWSWKSGGLRNMQDLCGYAHGASGYAHAFLELYASTGDVRWRYNAACAIDYERHCGGPKAGDWWDYRHVELSTLTMQSGGVALVRRRLLSGSSNYSATPSAMRAWCHGAPGIALTRLRAAVLGVDATLCDSEARSALASTVESLAGQLSNYSLCHGICGNAEAILTGSQRIGFEDHGLVAQKIAEGVQRCELERRGWPSGTMGAAEEPSLLLGDAGIGHFLLRMARPEVPSALFLSGWAPAPSQSIGNERDQLADNAERMFPVLASAVKGLSLRAEVRAAFEGALVSSRSAIDVIAAIEDALVAVGANDVGEILRDAMIGDVARLREDVSFDNFLVQFFDEVQRPSPSEIDWPRARFALAPHARLISTRWAWSVWDRVSSPTPVEEPEHFILYRYECDVRLQPMTALDALMLGLLHTPLTLSELRDSVVSQVDHDTVDPNKISAFVARALRSAVGAGAVVRVSEGAT